MINPWTAIWTRPRLAVRAAIEQDRDAEMYLLGVLGGLVNAFDNVADRGLGDTTALPFLLIYWLAAGTFGGLIGLLLGPAVLRWTGSWFGGEADVHEIRHAYAWSFVPLLPALVFTLGMVAIYGAEMFASQVPIATGDLALLLAWTATAAVLAVWAFVVFVVGLAEVQRFSVWRALASAALPVAVLIAAGFGLAAVVG